jgi:hypothetical protein
VQERLPIRGDFQRGHAPIPIHKLNGNHGTVHHVTHCGVKAWVDVEHSDGTSNLFQGVAQVRQVGIVRNVHRCLPIKRQCEETTVRVAVQQLDFSHLIGRHWVITPWTLAQRAIVTFVAFIAFAAVNLVVIPHFRVRCELIRVLYMLCMVLHADASAVVAALIHAAHCGWEQMKARKHQSGQRSGGRAGTYCADKQDLQTLLGTCISLWSSHKRRGWSTLQDDGRRPHRLHRRSKQCRLDTFLKAEAKEIIAMWVKSNRVERRALNACERQERKRSRIQNGCSPLTHGAITSRPTVVARTCSQATCLTFAMTATAVGAVACDERCD